MKQFSITLEPRLVGLIDLVVKKEKIYHSRNDFVRDAIRTKLLELQRIELRKDLKKMAKTALARGWNGELITKEQKDEIARELLIEKGINPDILAP